MSTNNQKTVLVLGSTGTTGREVVRALLETDATVRAATRNPSAVDANGAHAVRFDPDDESTWRPALEGVDSLYFVLPAFRPDETELGKRIITAAKESGVTRIVKLSAAGVAEMPKSGHRQLELFIEASGLEWIHLRPTFFIDNFVHFYGHPIATAGIIPLPAGDGRTAFVAASDIGDVAAKALLSDETGKVWTLTGAESLTHDEVAAILSDVLGRDIRFVNITPEEHIAGMEEAGMPPLGREIMSGLYGFVRQGYTAEISPDVERMLGRAVTVREWAEANRGAWDQFAMSA